MGEKTNRLLGGEAFGPTCSAFHELRVEEVELTSPRDALREAGAEIDLLAPEDGEIQAFNHLDKGDTFIPDKAVGEADPDDYDGLVLPGGVANPDQLRTDTDAVQFVRSFFEEGKPVGAICHGPWTLINAESSAHLLASLQADLRNTGAEWVVEDVYRGRPRGPAPERLGRGIASR